MSDYEPLKIKVEKFRGNRIGLLELISVIQTTVAKVPENPKFIFKCELIEEPIESENKREVVCQNCEFQFVTTLNDCPKCGSTNLVEVL